MEKEGQEKEKGKNGDKKQGKEKDVFLKKAIVYVVLFVLAVPLLIIILINFSRRMANLEGQDLSGALNLPEASTGTGSFAMVGDALKEIEDSLKILENMSTSTPTSTDL